MISTAHIYKVQCDTCKTTSFIASEEDDLTRLEHSMEVPGIEETIIGGPKNVHYMTVRDFDSWRAYRVLCLNCLAKESKVTTADGTRHYYDELSNRNYGFGWIPEGNSYGWRVGSANVTYRTSYINFYIDCTTSHLMADVRNLYLLGKSWEDLGEINNLNEISENMKKFIDFMNVKLEGKS